MVEEIKGAVVTALRNGAQATPAAPAPAPPAAADPTKIPMDRPSKPMGVPVPKRFGKFVVSFHFLELDDPMIRHVMRQVVVIDARANFATASVEYIALSDAFAEVAHNAEPPSYQAIVTSKDDQISVSWERVGAK